MAGPQLEGLKGPQPGSSPLGAPPWTAEPSLGNRRLLRAAQNGQRSEASQLLTLKVASLPDEFGQGTEI